MAVNLDKRFMSLDVFRGLAIASMILVNNPGSWSHVYPPLRHAKWHGFTPTDWVFPAFLFVSGATMAFSLRKYLQDREQPTQQVYLRIIRRCVVLFLLGLFLNGSSIVMEFLFNPSPENDWMTLFTEIRIMGVLQRIAVAYFLAAMAILTFSKRQLWGVLAVILLGYWGIMMLIPVPGYGIGDLSPEGNVAAYLDRLILATQHLYKPTYDPEGLFSTLPAVGTVLLGYFTGDWLRKQPKETSTTLGLVAFGLMGLIIGLLWGLVFPINKQLWTSSYVLYSAGWSWLILALFYELIEVRQIRRWSFPLQIMGLNAIFVFVASGLLARVLYQTSIGTGENAPSTYTWLYQTLFEPWAGSVNGSLFFAITNVIFWGIVVYLLYRCHVFIKI
ncbi:heparan-alpha-glucosaminide N-acetyltransferase domain-containing protein [Spirulina sp. CS-785/01]|uniref:acyltransferase family protein n=1 Tax=Spirulina sp. CS-785/01 TaxID=3021716 RepID=UPI002330943F|nr:heparan-alpha-glucosaminide N-acetyltransferase domain-containing protein [Spirulina sp. CS-785/01]MDB9315696.1 heparan-alpha-glucosaminide N-acetyltransferase domain-containing protein [Spirulina sp. CS-785/01]